MPTSIIPASAWPSSAGCWRAAGFKVGIIAQPDWQSTRDFEALGAPRLFFGVTGGNMDSMVNRYTSDRRVRSDDAYTPGGRGRQAAGPLRHRVLAAYPRGLQGHSHRDRRHRGEPAPHRAFRLLVGACAPLGTGGLRKRIFWSTAMRSGRSVEIARRLECGRGHRGDHGFARHGISAARHAGRLGGDRFERAGCARAAGPADRSLCQRGGARKAPAAATPRLHRRRRGAGHRRSSNSTARCRTRSASTASSACRPSSR